MAEQDLGGRENVRKKRGQSQGVTRVVSQTRKRQHGKFIDEVNKPRGSTQMNRNGFI